MELSRACLDHINLSGSARFDELEVDGQVWATPPRDPNWLMLARLMRLETHFGCLGNCLAHL